MLTLDLADAAATERLGAALAALARAGDFIGLSGPLGAGKTTLARAFVRARGERGEVPSPTFTLVQVYDLPDGAVWHADLYRLERPEDARELGLEDAHAIVLAEWPGRMGPLPHDRLDVTLEHGAAPGERRATLAAHGSWVARIDSLRART